MKEQEDNLTQNEFSRRFERQWLIYGGVGILSALLAHLGITELGLLETVSWGIIAFFLIYTAILFGIFWYFGKLYSSGNGPSSWRPNGLNGLARFRSYLQFLPITHIIQHGDVKDSLQRNLEIGKSEKLDENELSIRISIQKELVIEAILDEYIAPWYTKISSNTAFLVHSRDILQLVFQQLGQKLRQVDRNNLAKEAIQTVHLHWKEYCDASLKCSSDGASIIKCFKFVHPYLQDSAEVAQRCEKMICELLEDFVIPEMQSSLLCQFLSGILVKSFFIYYLELICQPSWINNNLISLLASGSFLAELAGGSSQNSSAPATPLPERSPKNISISGDTSCSAITTPTATPSDSTASGLTPPQKTLPSGSNKPLETDEEQNFFFNKDILQSSLLLDNKILGGGDKFSNRCPSSLSKTSRSQGSPSPSPSVSSALSGVLPTTALPLLPSCSYILDQTFGFGSASINPDEECGIDAVTMIPDFPDIHMSSSSSPSFTNRSDARQQDKQEGLSLKLNADEEADSITPKSENNTDGNSQDENPSVVFKVSTPTHYYSFEEVSTRKPSHPLLETGTLSVDGAIDGLKKPEQKSNTHQLKIVADCDSKHTGRSPVYEEPEDFATSIAKLRSLLEQRESRKNLNCKVDDNDHQNQKESNGVGENGDDKGDLGESLNSSSEEKTFKQLDELGCENRDDDQLSGSNLDGQEEGVPELKRYFHNITIPKVESFNHSGGHYDFYCIQYEGIYFDEKYDDDLPRVILRNTTVKRRFKEFLLLQSKLEEYPQWKHHLKGIKAPNRWLNLSFSKMDAATTKKIMLEKYLNQICSHSVLGSSREVLQFMAYGDEGFALDPMDINDPKHLLSNKLDKLAKKFTGVLNSLKDALPSFDSNPPSPHSDTDTPGFTQLHDSIPSFQFNESLCRDEMEGDGQSIPTSLDPKWFESLVPNHDEDDDHIPNNDAQNSSANPNLNSDNEEEGLEDETSAAYPLAAALTQLLCDVLWLSNCRPHNASVSTFMSISGKSLENYVQETIDVFLSDEAVLGYLEWLAKSLKSDVDSLHDFQYEGTSEMDLKNCLRRRIPAWVRWMWGRNRLDLTIERITGFFQNPVINQDLVLSLSELLFSKIISE